jgi:hypothetical protein
MQLDNTLYAAVQIAHNLGAVAAVGAPLAALRYAASGATLRKTYALTLAAWIVQIASGAGFGFVSYFVVGELPQIDGAALVAFVAKIGCAILSMGLLLAKLSNFGQALSDKAALACLAGLGAAALLGAAILRWFS